MNSKELDRNIHCYYWYVALSEPLFWGPILITYMNHIGQMPLSTIYLMEAVVVLSLIFLEVPSGALADIIGRKKTVVIGSALALIDSIWFAIADSPLDIWIANIIWVVGHSLKSGADTALVYDSLKGLGRESEYERIEGVAVSGRLMLFAIGSLITGFLAEIHLRLPVVLSAIGMIVPLLAAFSFKESTLASQYNPQKQLNLIKTSLLFVVKHKEIKWVVGFAALVAVVSKVWFFTYNPYFEMVGLELKYYGMLFFLMSIIAWFFSRYAYYLSQIIPEKTIVMIMVGLLALPIILMGVVVVLPIVSLVLLQNIVRGFAWPFFRRFLNSRIESENRATIISIQSAVNGLAQFMFLSLFGLLLNNYELPTCLLVLGLFTLGAGVFGIYRYNSLALH